MKNASHGISYRPDIDGLRAVAIISVVIYHALPDLFTGGFVGVDVFFVISGFLISSIIFRKLHQGTFSFAGFYLSRTRRLLPALVTVLVATYAAGWILLMPQEFSQLGIQIIGGATFLQNFVLWQQDGYFNTASELKPLMHLWSLGIEEQFYLIYPAILLFAFRKNKCLPTIAAIAIISFLLNVGRIQGHPVEVFFLPHTRFWELLSGAAIAYLMLRPDTILHRMSGAISNLATALGLVLIVGAAVLLDSHRAFPGWWALIPVSGAVLLLATANRSTLGRSILGNRVLVYIGLISYPLYLWHWPLISFGKLLDPDLQQGTRIALALASVPLAALTYHFIEKPLRMSMRPRIAIPALGGTLVIAGALGAQAVASQGVPSRLPEAMQAVATYNYQFKGDARGSICWLNAKASGSAFAPECFENLDRSGGKSLIVWGDSFAARLYPGVLATLGDRYSIAQTTRNSCPPMLDSQYDTCKAGNAFTLSLIKQHPNATVLMFAVWDQYTKDWEKQSDERDALILTIRSVKAAGVKNVILVGPAPRWPENLPSLVLKTWKSGAISQEAPTRLQTPLSPMIRSIDSTFRKIAKAERITYVSAFDSLCNNDGCLVRTNDSPTSFTTWDDGHLTTDGAKVVAKSIPLD
ncbi:acyltransferase family protein [Achromobacter spanius]|uniref:Acyltransferase n=1 Tax=Achromobacter spanius TaxID=217203 RepID=A0AAW3I5R3_9BURK|nr:acyltransferase family protein [Achromobacter spanius]KNE28225.1 hypothetical protein AFM18_08685 [Achromobacter spanius]